jgi:hypothetical protein
MAISRRFPIPFDLVFPYGAYLVSEVSPVFDYERSTKETKVQQADPETGLLLWQVDVLDADPEAKKSTKTVSVKIPAKVQPVPPGNDTPFPFTPVVFEGMTALPWIEETGNFSKISWSLKATAIRPVTTGSTAGLATGSTKSASAA